MCCYQKHSEPHQIHSEYSMPFHTSKSLLICDVFPCFPHSPQPHLYTFLLSKLSLPGFSYEEPTYMELIAFFLWISTKFVYAPCWIIGLPQWLR